MTVLHLHTRQEDADEWHPLIAHLHPGILILDRLTRHSRVKSHPFTPRQFLPVLAFPCLLWWTADPPRPLAA
jgi:metallophosphoesterase superfamily enzyme